ncbi:unnamed protein product, partial [Strongylus vulgaris]
NDKVAPLRSKFAQLFAVVNILRDESRDKEQSSRTLRGNRGGGASSSVSKGNRHKDEDKDEDHLPKKKPRRVITIGSSSSSSSEDSRWSMLNWQALVATRLPPPGPITRRTRTRSLAHTALNSRHSLLAFLDRIACSPSSHLSYLDLGCIALPYSYMLKRLEYQKRIAFYGGAPA